VEAEAVDETLDELPLGEANGLVNVAVGEGDNIGTLDVEIVDDEDEGVEVVDEETVVVGGGYCPVSDEVFEWW